MSVPYANLAFMWNQVVLPRVGDVYVFGGSMDPNATQVGTDCLAEGTLVTTARGDVPIEQLTTQDRVLTRRGYRRVLRAWKVRDDAPTVELTVEDRTLCATPEHLIWTENRGWVAFNSVTGTDTLVLCRDQKRSSITVVSPSHSRGQEARNVRRSVVSNIEKSTTRRPVYDVSVEGEHEFFANGILVHNCSGLVSEVNEALQYGPDMNWTRQFWTGTFAGAVPGNIGPFGNCAVTTPWVCCDGADGAPKDAAMIIGVLQLSDPSEAHMVCCAPAADGSGLVAMESGGSFTDANGNSVLHVGPTATSVWNPMFNQHFYLPGPIVDWPGTADYEDQGTLTAIWSQFL